MVNAFTTVIFDVGNVLVRWDPAKVIAENFSEEVVEIFKSVEKGIHTHWHGLDQGIMTRDEAIFRFAEIADISVELMQEVYVALRNSLDLNVDTYDLLMDFSIHDYTLFCISNMSLDFWEYLKNRYAFWSVFSDIIISAQVGMIKPGKEIFRHAIDRFAIDPTRSIFIDDSPPNIAAAAELGFVGILFKNARQCRRRFEKISGNSLPRKLSPH